jgi:prepilin-type N-terminal cleavage/methylation domain-containing protein
MLVVRSDRLCCAVMRPAFTLVELLVAIAVLTVGLLALAATAGIVASHVGDGARLTDSAHLTRSILDSLATSDCAAVAGGRIARAGVSAEWTVTRDSTAAVIDLQVGSELRRGTKRDAYRALVPCGRD